MAKPKDERQEIVWDKKKIFIFLISALLLVFLILELKTFILGDSVTNNSSKTSNSKKVEGATSENLPDLRQGVQNQISNLKKEAENINVLDIATSSAQVQKVIKDLKDLQNLPQSQFKNACEKICNGL